MAKGSRASNPVEAHRKAERKKELKKNKDQRVKNREISTVKKDTGGLEAEIRRLEESERKGELDKNAKERLGSLRKEVDHIRKTKADYVTAHPEHEKFVYPGKKSEASTSSKVSTTHVNELNTRLFGSNGLPLHPERSIYYDQLLNPTGMPPPGAVYMERPLLPHEMPSATESDRDQEDDGDSEDDIPLPSGPPPVHESDESDDDIPMPEGPPPGAILPPISLPNFSIAPSPYIPPPPPGGPPVLSHVSPPPPGFPSAGIPPPPPGFPPASAMAASSQISYFPAVQVVSSTHLDAGVQRGIPSPASLGATQAPKTTTPLPPPHPSLPKRPVVISGNATITAEPELRDLKRESTAFIPAAVKRRKAEPAPQRVNAAPNDGDAPVSPGISRPDLLATLRQAGIGTTLQQAPQTASKQKDDYENFLEEMGDILK